MKIKLLPAVICFTCLLFKVFPSVGQLTGIKNIPGEYATVSLAVTALNGAGVGVFQKDPSTSGANPLMTASITGVDQLPLLQQYLTILQLRVNLRSNNSL